MRPEPAPNTPTREVLILLQLIAPVANLSYNYIRKSSVDPKLALGDGWRLAGRLGAAFR